MYIYAIFENYQFMIELTITQRLNMMSTQYAQKTLCRLVRFERKEVEKKE